MGKGGPEAMSHFDLEAAIRWADGKQVRWNDLLRVLDSCYASTDANTVSLKRFKAWAERKLREKDDKRKA